MTAYYGGRNLTHHRNIVWSNGALDPWSGQGVYPPDGGPAGGTVRATSSTPALACRPLSSHPPLASPRVHRCRTSPRTGHSSRSSLTSELITST